MADLQKTSKWIIQAEKWRFLADEYRFIFFPAKDFVGRVDVYGNLPSGDGKLILYGSCDQTYFDHFATDFISSAILSNPTALVHLHVVDPAPRTLHQFDDLHSRFPTLSLTFEAPLLGSLPVEFKRCYYASIRFIRILDILATCRNPIFCVDVDTIIRGDLQSINMIQPGADLLIPLSLKEDDLKRRVRAVFFRRTERTSKFVFQLASRLQRHLNSKRTAWGIDQQCLYHTLRECEVDYKNLPLQFLDHELRPESLVWNKRRSTIGR